MGYSIKQNKVWNIPKRINRLSIRLSTLQSRTVDFACYMLDSFDNISDTICYQNLLAPGVEMKDSGLEINIDITKLESNIRYMLFAVSLFEPVEDEHRKESISDYPVTFHLYDTDNSVELFHFTPKNKDNKTGIYLGFLEKTYPYWNYKAIGKSLDGDIVEIREKLLISDYKA